MRWNIDRDLKALEASPISETLINRVTLIGRELLVQQLGKSATKAELEQGYARVWCLALGKVNERKLLIYAPTIRETYLKARRVLRRLSQEELDFYGLRAPRHS